MRSFATATRRAALIWLAMWPLPLALPLAWAFPPAFAQGAPDQAPPAPGPAPGNQPDQAPPPGQAQSSDQTQSPDQAQSPDQDPPTRVARLSVAGGSVSLEPAGAQEWATADVNRPVTTGDKLWTDQNSRAELDLGPAAIRLGGSTGFSFLNLDDHTAQMQVTAGTVIVRVREMDQNDNFEIDTPNLALSLMRPGQYRVDVNDAGDTTVVEVSDGDAQATGDGQGYPIHSQQKATFVGTQQLSSVLSTLGAPDDFDNWSLSRDRQVQSAQSQQYVSTDAPGYADLDSNGTWQDTPDYGYVWTPTTVAAGWAPYRFGHWVWITPWGWTWIDDASWGFAPFHYGRWVTWRGSWAWVPGPRRVAPVYAPALVVWVGAPAVAVAVGAGVGWFPLGPREVYIPSYRTSPRYVNLVNVTNTVIINKTYINNVYQNRVTDITYINRNARGAFTAVPQGAFSSAQPVARNLIANADISAWSPRRVAPAIVPTRASLVGAGGVSAHRPPPGIMGRQVVVRTQPPRPPVPFDRQLPAIRANGGQPIGRPELARLQTSTPAGPVRVVTPRRGGGERPTPNDTSIADRARALRDTQSFGTAAPRSDRPAPAQGNFTAPPRNGFQPGTAAPPRNELQPGNPVPPRNEFQSRSDDDGAPQVQPRLDRTQPRQVQPSDPQPRTFQPPPEPRAAPQVRQPPPAPAARPEQRDIPRQLQQQGSRPRSEEKHESSRPPPREPPASQQQR
jgi:hypothetical protein